MNNLKKSFLTTKDIEMFIDQATTEEIIETVLAQDDLNFEMVVAWGTYSESYDYADKQLRRNMLNDAIVQMPKEVLVEIFEKKFI